MEEFCIAHFNLFTYSGKRRRPGDNQPGSRRSLHDIQTISRVEVAESRVFPGHLWIQSCDEATEWCI